MARSTGPASPRQSGRGWSRSSPCARPDPKWWKVTFVVESQGDAIPRGRSCAPTPPATAKGEQSGESPTSRDLFEQIDDRSYRADTLPTRRPGRRPTGTGHSGRPSSSTPPRVRPFAPRPARGDSLVGGEAAAGFAARPGGATKTRRPPGGDTHAQDRLALPPSRAEYTRKNAGVSCEKKRNHARKTRLKLKETGYALLEGADELVAAKGQRVERVDLRGGRPDKATLERLLLVQLQPLRADALRSAGRCSSVSTRPRTKRSFASRVHDPHGCPGGGSA